jgi:ATP-dependent Clp protease ATP-binding subunit ClpC
MMWKIFSEPARRVVWFAQEEARLIGWKEIQPIHLFSGIFRDRECHAAKSLEFGGIEWGILWKSLQEKMPQPDLDLIQEFSSEDMKLNSESVTVFEHSYEYINIWKNRQFTTAHLLLALLDFDIMLKHGLSDLDFHEGRVYREAKRLKNKIENNFLREKAER